MLLFFFFFNLFVSLSQPLAPATRHPAHANGPEAMDFLLFVGTIPTNCPPLRNCTACLGPLNRFWPSVCWELRKIPNSQLSSGHGPNDRRSSSARWKRLEGLCA
ncbi:hypothetical protein ACQKWADRAFT_279996 [Trichoderma austrokoningii]